MHVIDTQIPVSIATVNDENWWVKFHKFVPFLPNLICQQLA